MINMSDEIDEGEQMKEGEREREILYLMFTFL
jgi:hypothetical protein